MKQKTTKILSLILALILFTGAFAPLCFAGENHEQVPVIVVPGFMSTDIYADKNDPQSELVWPPKTDDILEAVKGLVPALARFGLDFNKDRFCDAVIPLVNDIFAPAVLNPDGTPKGDSGVLDFYPPAQDVNAFGVYTFRYDWRIDPMEIASQLNTFIDFILENSGCDKVSIESHSLGGLITTTYMALYGDAKLKNIVMNSTAVFGESFNGELLNGNIHLKGDALVKYMKFTFEGNQYETLLNKIFEILQKGGVLDLVCQLGNDFVDAFSYRVIPESIAPLFAGWLTIWGMIPDEYIDGAMDYIFNTVYQNDETHAALKEKVTAFNQTVRCRKAEVLQQANEHANLFVIARYGYSAIPVTPAYNRMTDCSVDTTYASYGAICAEYDKYLTQEQISGVSEAYISPDLKINAATCLFPEQTWFVRDLSHSRENEDFALLINTLLGADEQYTVDTLPGFSRFMTVEGERLVPTQKQTPDAGHQGIFGKLKAFFEALIEKLALYMSTFTANC